MKIGAIIQARMGSTRLPGKILKKVLGKTLLEYQIERVKRSKLINEIVIATTISDNDTPIVELCESLGISYYRGSEDDVLSRYYEAANEFSFETIIRLTSDCPLIDHEIIDQTIELYLSNQFDYTANIINRKFPRGLDVEVFSKETLKKLHETARKHGHREHVTTFIFDHQELFKMGSLEAAEDFSHLRWTVDTIEDFLLIEKILTAIYPVHPTFLTKDVIELLNRNKDWMLLNSAIQQKKY
ncbi:acylneuraminate cytidylyltransferase [Bacillus sp. S3]|uniref:cytidylyltransferase domain-containing protein n=1 Tax=Bacillus sp. S3 TaxID=486398 RepID=UPI00118B7B87|nr:glycosyltransferase family protein [Bacillus sp. S3]QCJ40992.1 acylneuraminate cytidylyltransferase [Bacillus sp. S3]